MWGWSSFYGEKFRLWQYDMEGDNTSEALFDPYTFAHATGAGLQFLFIPPFWLFEPRLGFLILNFAFHLIFEMFENTTCAIKLCRTLSTDTRYKGDTILNSIGDLITFVVFYTFTWIIWMYFKLYCILVPSISSFVFCCFYLQNKFKHRVHWLTETT